MELKVKAVSPKIGTEIPAPFYATPGAAAMDLHACVDGAVTIPAGGRRVIPTGIAIALPSAEYVALVFARSGLGIKHGVAPANCVGVIDSDYRGEIMVGLHNAGESDYTVQPGDRIAQLMVVPVVQAQVQMVEELDDTARGAGGFGSTGRELKAIPDEQVKPVSTWVPDLGTFVLNRSVNWFQADVEWQGQSVQLVYDQGSEEEMKAAQETAKALMDGQAEWDQTIRAYAAGELPAQCADLQEDEMDDLPAEELIRRLEPESIQVRPDGSFEFWFHDADYVWTRAVRVAGDLQNGPAAISLED